MNRFHLKFLIILCFFSTLVFSQTGVVSGTLTDASGQPFAGVNVLVKGTSNGTITDFDGNYTLTCKIGDILVFTYIGLETKEVIVTANMFKNDKEGKENVPVTTIHSIAYERALNSAVEKDSILPSIQNSISTYKVIQTNSYNRIKDIQIQDNKVKLTHFDTDVFFEINYSSNFWVRFFQERNLPSLQSIYSQGTATEGEIIHQGPETNAVFSYGPKLSNLEFNGSNYEFDSNGRLVPLGDGNGVDAIAYNNKVLKTSILNSNNLTLGISTYNTHISLNLGRTSQKDLFNKELSFGNEIGLNIKKSAKRKRLGWNTSIKFLNHKNNQPNINGFINNVLLNSWITPPSFSNAQGDRLANNAQRSFAPIDYNNPIWLLNNNINSERQNTFLTRISNEYELSETIHIESNISYNSYESVQDFGLPRNTIGFMEGYKSNKTITENNFSSRLNIKFNLDKSDYQIEAFSSNSFLYESMDYKFSELTGFESLTYNEPTSTFDNNKSLNRNILRLHNRISIGLNEPSIKFEVTNNSYLSSLQNDIWFLPTLRLESDLVQLLNIRFMDELTVSATTSYDVNDAPLFYNNFSHNSLNMLPSESLGYTANNDLFVNETLKLEEKRTHTIGALMRIYPLNIQLGLNYFNSLNKGSVFPVFNQGDFNLLNIADVSNNGFEASMEAYVRFSNNFNYSPSILFSTYKPTVEKLYSDDTRIPIAGFASTSKNLIADEVAGVIVGSAYARDDNGNVIIDADGFPMVSEDNKIIGNPIPDYNLSISNNFELGDFKLSVLLDIQKGGDVWNGTQNTLNYFGTSQLSAEQRGITDFIFEGVDVNGQTNATQVDFYNPENGIENNRFVRYGFEGIAEEANVDGSYLNIKSVNLSYGFDHKTDQFFRGFEIGLYANNILTFSKFRGATPYNSLFGHKNSHGLNFFNQPLESEVGLKLKLKI